MRNRARGLKPQWICAAVACLAALGCEATTDRGDGSAPNAGRSPVFAPDGAGGSGGAAAATGGGSGAGGDGGAAATGGSAGAGGSGGAAATGGSAGTSGSGGAAATDGGAGSGDDWYPCDGDTSGYDVTAIEAGGTWTVRHGASIEYTGASMEQAIVAALASLTANRTSKESVLVQGDGAVAASTQLRIPSHTILNVCGTIDVTGTASGSDRSPVYARGATDIDIPHVTITGNPQYAMFFRETHNVHLGQVVMKLDPSAGRGLRIDHSSSSSPGKPMYRNYQIDSVYVSGSGGHGVETYGIDNLTIGEFVGENTGDCGLLLNYTTHAEVGSVHCNGCAGGTTYAAFRIANQAGNVDDNGTYPAGNIHVGEINATGGGRGIFCVSASGGLTVERFHIDHAGASPEIFIENCYNVTLATEAGTLAGGQARIGYNAGNGDPSSNVVFQNMTLDNASVLEQPCNWGDLGNRALNVTGGAIDMCN